MKKTIIAVALALSLALATAPASALIDETVQPVYKDSSIALVFLTIVAAALAPGVGAAALWAAGGFAVANQVENRDTGSSPTPRWPH